MVPARATDTPPRTLMTMAKRNCPYCAHPNATDAKFCVACGAVMHLAPCPHCGSINHINVANCYRCGGDLPKQEILEGEPEAAPVAADNAEAQTQTSQPPLEGAATLESTAVVSNAPATVLVREADAQAGRPSLAVMFIIIFSFVFAGIYAYRHRVVDPREDAAKATTPASAAKPLQQSLPVTPAATPSIPVASPVVEPAKPVAEPIVQPSAKPAPKTAAKSAADAPPKPAAPATPCTEAVAALGLCKLNTK